MGGMMNAQEAFLAWVLKSAAIVGGVVAVALFVAVFVVAMSARKREE